MVILPFRILSRCLLEASVRISIFALLKSDIFFSQSLTRKVGTASSVYHRGNLIWGLGYTGDKEAEKPNMGRRGDPELSGRPLPPLGWRDKGERWCSQCPGLGSL